MHVSNLIFRAYSCASQLKGLYLLVLTLSGPVIETPLKEGAHLMTPVKLVTSLCAQLKILCDRAAAMILLLPVRDRGRSSIQPNPASSV